MSQPKIVALKDSEQKPYNIALEQSLLGALLARNKRIEDVVEFLEPEHFSEKIHTEIYKAIRSLFEQGRTADDKTLSQYFLNNSFFEKSGGINYLKSLLDSVVSFVHVKDYGETIYDLYLRRSLMDLGDELIKSASKISTETKATDTIEEIEKKLFNLVSIGSSEKNVIPFADALGQAITRAEMAYKRDSHIVGITTGLIDLDRMLGGVHPSDLIIIAGRPSMGKTALGTSIAFNAAKAFKKENNEESSGGPVAFFSLEMSSEQLAGRILSAESGIPSDQIRRGELKFEDFPKFLNIAQELNSLPLFIDDTPGISVTSIRNRARRLKRLHNIQLIVIDYLQLLTVGGSRKSENRVQEISEITRALKALAKELDVPVIALSQLSRAVEQREDKRPQLSDLRESGTIEQDADVVMFIYRQEYYESRKQPESGTDEHAAWLERMERVHNKAELIVAKQRHGPIGTVSLYYDGRLVSFGNFVKTN